MKSLDLKVLGGELQDLLFYTCACSTFESPRQDRDDPSRIWLGLVVAGEVPVSHLHHTRES